MIASGNFGGFSEHNDTFYATFVAFLLYTAKCSENTYVCLRGLAYIHTCRSYVHTPRERDRHVSHKSLEASHYNNGVLADSSDFGLLGEQIQKWEMNRRAKFDAASIILCGEIRNRTNEQTVQTNKQTNKQ